MPITFDIEEDIMYKQGLEQGIEQEQERNLAAQKQIIRKMHAGGIPVAQIAGFLMISVAFVEEVLNETEQK